MILIDVEKCTKGDQHLGSWFSKTNVDQHLKRPREISQTKN